MRLKGKNFLAELCNPAVFAKTKTHKNRCNSMSDKKWMMGTGECHSLFVFLTQHIDPASKNGLERGIVGEAAKLFDVDRKTVSRKWRDARAKMVEAGLGVDEMMKDASLFVPNTSGRGRKKKYDRKEFRKSIKAMKLKERTTFRAIAVASQIPQSTIYRMMKIEKVVKRHSSALHPCLKEENKAARVFYCLEEVNPVADDNGKYYFKNEYDRIDVDEKWFKMTRDGEKYILCDSDFEDSDGESDSENNKEDPTRRTRHKGYIGKVMFLCAQARPRWDPHRNAYWDGKLGIWPIGS